MLHILAPGPLSLASNRRPDSHVDVSASFFPWTSVVAYQVIVTPALQPHPATALRS